MIVATSRGATRFATGAQGACFTQGKRSAPVSQSDRTRWRFDRSEQQRIREGLELQLIALGVARPEQLADALLQEVAQ